MYYRIHLYYTMSVCTGIIVSMYLKGRIEDVLVCDDKKRWVEMSLDYL